MVIRSITKLFIQFYDILKKETKFVWNEKLQQAFEDIKKLWLEKLELTIPDLNGDFVFESDAFKEGIGAILIQNEKPVAFVSEDYQVQKGL